MAWEESGGREREREKRRGEATWEWRRGKGERGQTMLERNGRRKNKKMRCGISVWSDMIKSFGNRRSKTEMTSVVL